MKITVQYDDAVYQHIKQIEHEGFVYARVKSHLERYGQSILYYPDTFVDPKAGGIPSVMQRIQTPQEHPVTMTRALQEWTYELIMSQAPSNWTVTQIKKCWSKTYQSDIAFANKTGPDWIENDELAYADWINGTNLNADGWKLQPTISHMHTIKILRIFEKAGITQAAFEIANAQDPNTLNMTRANNWNIIMPAVNWSRGRRADGSLTPGFPQGYAEPFPWLDGRDTLVPMLGNGVYESYIDNDWLEYLPAGTNSPAYPYTLRQS